MGEPKWAVGLGLGELSWGLLVTLHSSRGWGDRPGTGLPPLPGLQHWHHHHSPAGRLGQPRRHVTLCSSGNGLKHFPVHRPAQAGYIPGSPWVPQTLTTGLQLYSQTQGDIAGTSQPKPQFFLSRTAFPERLVVIPYPLSLYYWQPSRFPKGPLLLWPLHPGVSKCGCLVHTCNVTLPKFLFLHVPVFPGSILVMLQLSWASFIMPPEPRHSSASKLWLPNPKSPSFVP